MQNYNAFVDELFRLNIATVQYFVKDGQVLYREGPQYYTAEQLAGVSAKQLPGHLSTFAALDQYQPDEQYANTLDELKERALIDLLSVEPAQTTRYLSTTKTKYEKLNRLSSKANEYSRAWTLNTLDELPSLFLESRVIQPFTGTRPAYINPHPIFAEQLAKVIAIKSGQLLELIEQAETVLQPAPAVIADSDSDKRGYISEPNYQIRPELKESRHFKKWDEEIKSHEFVKFTIQGEQVRVYVNLLAAFLSSDEVAVWGVDKQESTVIRGQDYLPGYVESYKKGVKEFDDRYPFPASPIFCENSKLSAQELHYEFFHPEDEDGIWHYINSQPILINQAIVNEYGRYAGYIGRFKDNLKKHKVFFDKYVLQCEDQTTPATDQPDVTPDQTKGKKPQYRPFPNFTDKLLNGFTEQRLNALLVYMRMKDQDGNTLAFEKYLLHPVIDALVSEGYFDAGSRERDFNALARFLGLSEGRIKQDYGKPGIEKKTLGKATTYLQEEHKKNSSFSVP